MAPPTILAHKSTFLAAQTLQLSRGLAPSHAWRAANEAAEDGIPSRAVEDALYRLNNALQQHVKRVYPLQATRHVAEQIDSLFLDGGGRDGDDDDEDGLEGEESLREGIDLGLLTALYCTTATDHAIASLPPTWDAHAPAEAEAQPPEAHRYAELQSSLTSLSARRAEITARVERLRHMRALLEPFQENNVQENLVTRNGEVEKELERMRFLLVRVAGRIGQLPDPARDAETDDDVPMEDLDELEKKKVDALLDTL
ncbi:uncharacterized protein JN550_007524 [Neoarthrinium moseri]|uniref:uncharacterized protein n=1 Tax=Neoarthrinium moseri TaxID=1658444 RepID=UPI001FDC969A|nr:uncharacterized protein JN550_007524 [Neoarthrinium moseri]KAI1866671.1 hypothetical protein JN550_007524 [Neoarthrinium moseri]